MSAREVMIIGGGIGGLVAALALHHRGIKVQVHEQAPQLGEVGAGFTIARGSQRVFETLGLLDEVQRRSIVTTKMAFVHYRTAAMLSGQPDLGDGINRTSDMVGRHMHRADLHDVLSSALMARAPGALHLNHRLVGIDEHGERVRATFANGDVAEADALVGADGVRSQVRALLWGASEPRFTGQIAYRCLLPYDVAQPFMSTGRATLFIGPGRVLSRYTVRQNQIVNCVGITRSDDWLDEGWSTPATPEEMAALYQGWHPDVVNLVARAPRAGLIKWGLFDRPPLARWSQGRVTLLGDAAHPMLPFLGLGAAMAIEDGSVLGQAFDAESQIPAAFARYEAARHGRVDQIAELSRLQGEMTQAQNPDQYQHASAPAGNLSLYDFDPAAPLP